MKPIFLVCMFVAGALANNYGQVSISYGQNTPAVVSYGSPAPSAPAISYTAPAPVVRAPVIPSYAAPAPVVRAPVVNSYSAPAPAAPAVPSYGSYGSSNSEQPQNPPIPIMRYNHEMVEGQSHRVSFETGHGISHEEHTAIRMNPNAVGTAEDADAGKAMITKTGSYSYTSPEGKRINMQYTADENGFHPVGDHLPVAPALPQELVEAMRQFQTAYNLAAEAAAAAPAASSSSGSYGNSYNSYSAPAPAPVVRAPPAVVRSPY